MRVVVLIGECFPIKPGKLKWGSCIDWLCLILTINRCDSVDAGFLLLVTRS